VFACLFVCFRLTRRGATSREMISSSDLSAQEGWGVYWQTYLHSSRTGLSLTSGRGARTP